LNFSNIILLLGTIKYLRFTQIVYQFYYKLRSVYRKTINFHYLLSKSSISFCLKIQPAIPANLSNNQKCFTFLNISKSFSNGIDWNYPNFGKLWTYNLTYFDFLQQEKINKETGLKLIYDFIDQQVKINDGLEPFPISLRGINWIKFLSKHSIHNRKISDSLFSQYDILMNNLEYHLLGNHLLENGFSLLFGAYYFQDEKLYKKSKQILINELEEQLLKDGAHFELSPMYHQLLLFRILDCINLVMNNPYKDKELISFLENKARLMLDWINTITFNNGDIPLFNDSARHIAPTTKQLNEYANSLNLKFIPIATGIQDSKLTESGYRKIENKKYEMVVDVGNIGPDYIPGHAHADTFNFELYIDQKPFIVDTGISTYEKNELRQLERSTESHNTVVVNNKNQSQVWGGFRVGKRAKIIDLKEDDSHIVASHNGYKKIGVIHQRSFKTKEIEIEIKDTLIGKKVQGKAYFHFHPSIKNIVIENDQVIFPDLNHKISFSGNHVKIERKMYDYALGFNKTQKSIVIQVTFVEELVSNILIKGSSLSKENLRSFSSPFRVGVPR
jgi:Heparinase II/III-like protein/Heparinase II/III N-terminus